MTFLASFFHFSELFFFFIYFFLFSVHVHDMLVFYFFTLLFVVNSCRPYFFSTLLLLLFQLFFFFHLLLLVLAINSTESTTLVLANAVVTLNMLLWRQLQVEVSQVIITMIQRGSLSPWRRLEVRLASSLNLSQGTRIPHFWMFESPDPSVSSPFCIRSKACQTLVGELP